MPSEGAITGLWPTHEPGDAEPGSRDRLIRAAVQLFQQRGYYAVGVAEILETAKVPRGSLYHHFPQGKAALAVAAIGWLNSEIIGTLQKMRRSGRGLRRYIEALAIAMADWLEETGWSQGSLLSVLAQEVIPHEEEISLAIAGSYREIQAEIAGWLAQEGAGEGAASEMAAVILSALQGAFILARATRSRAPLETVVRHLAIGEPKPPQSAPNMSDLLSDQ
jgi:TetR/AcrR family transcriptional regulator, lmrAB and yxaGH operons repressor